MRRIAIRRPIFNAPALIGKSKTTVNLSDAEVTITAPASLMHEIVQLCNGQRTHEEITHQLSSAWNKADVAALLQALETSDIIVNSNAIALKTLKYAANPRQFGDEITPKLSLAMAKSAMADSTRVVNGSRYFTPPKTSLSRLLNSRRSVREFSGAPVNFASLLAILWSAYGFTSTPSGQIQRKTVASGGALFPLRIYYLSLISTAELAQGIYSVRFDAKGRVGLKLVSENWRQSYRAYADPELLRFASGAIVVCADFTRGIKKYANRALLYGLLEAGHAIQNALLAAGDCKVGAVEVGGFMENQIQTLCRLGTDTHPLSTIVIGTAVSDKNIRKKGVQDLTFQWIDFDNDQQMPFVLANAWINNHKKNEGGTWGRDPDPLAAHDKAVAEAVERLGCASPQKLTTASFRDLTRAIDPRTVLAYSQQQYSRNVGRLHPFNPQKQYLWKKGYDLASGHAIHVLADLVYFSSALNGESSKKNRYTRANSSGVAAHLDQQTAFEGALLELIERDAFMRVWLCHLPTPDVPYQSLPGNIQKRIRYLQTLGGEIVVKLLPSPFAVAVLVFLQFPERGQTIVATAADYTPDPALDKALMEAESILFTHLGQGATPALLPSDVHSPADHARLYRQRRYFRKADFLGKRGAAVRLADAHKGKPGNFATLTDALLSRFDCIVQIDLTPSNAALANGRIPLHVVRAIVPGLIPITFGYDLEPALPQSGRLVAPNPRNRSNPLFPHPFS